MQSDNILLLTWTTENTIRHKSQTMIFHEFSINFQMFFFCCCFKSQILQVNCSLKKKKKIAIKIHYYYSLLLHYYYYFLKWKWWIELSCFKIQLCKSELMHCYSELILICTSELIGFFNLICLIMYMICWTLSLLGINISVICFSYFRHLMSCSILKWASVWQNQQNGM